MLVPRSLSSFQKVSERPTALSTFVRWWEWLGAPSVVEWSAGFASREMHARSMLVSLKERDENRS